MKMWLTSRLERILRRRKVPANSQLISGDEVGVDIQIDSLIYPLRYDVVVRAEFMAYYLESREVYSSAFDEFLAHPVAQAYFMSWFSDARRSRPRLGSDRAALKIEFASRVHRAVRLIESLESSGFDYRHPVELRAASLIRHEHDKRVRRRFYAGDGCHRLAFLASQGLTILTPRHYCVRVFEEFRPRDNTYLLLGVLLRREEEYCRIISKYYCDGERYDEPKEVLEYVRQHRPSELDEVTSVMQVDLKRISDVSGGPREASLYEMGTTRVSTD